MCSSLNTVRIAKWIGAVTLTISIGLSFSGCNAGARHKSELRKDSESYSLGYQTGKNMKMQKLEVNPDVYFAGIMDAIAGKPPQLDAEEMRAALTGMSKRIQGELKAQVAATAEKNLADGKAFLELNKEKEGIHVLPSGLQYRVLKEGTGKRPMVNDVVTVNYISKFVDGTEFASSYRSGKPISANLGRTIPGWKEALQLMKEGSRWELFVPSELAYGQRGTAGIEPNRALVFDVELFSIARALAGNGK